MSWVTQYIVKTIYGDIEDYIQKSALNRNGYAMNMYRNNNGKFNINSNNRDNRNSDNGLRQKFLAKSSFIKGAFVLLKILSNQSSS